MRGRLPSWACSMRISDANLHDCAWQTRGLSQRRMPGGSSMSRRQLMYCTCQAIIQTGIMSREWSPLLPPAAFCAGVRRWARMRCDTFRAASRKLGSAMTRSVAASRESVVMVPGGIMRPKPRYTAFMTLSGWSPNTGRPTTGMPWYAACAPNFLTLKYLHLVRQRPPFLKRAAQSAHLRCQ